MASHSRRSPSVLDISVAPNAWTIPVKHAELQEVLKSAANQILQHVDGRIGTIRVNKRQDDNLPIGLLILWWRITSIGASSRFSSLMRWLTLYFKR